MEDGQGNRPAQGRPHGPGRPLRRHGGPGLIAVDTNVLVYATVEDAPQHRRAREALGPLAEGATPWGIPVFCLGEYLRVTTHPRVLANPLEPETAIDALDRILESPSLRLLHPGTRFWPVLQDTLRDGGARGNRVFDAQIVAVCLENAVDTVLSEDRGLRRFTGIRLRPLPDEAAETDDSQ